jgi:membrane protein implicated in regulation of membrane protease activity
MPDWLIWLIVAAALAVGELATPGLFVLGLVAVAAVGAGLVAALGAGFTWQLLVFAAGLVAMLGVVRPIARRHVHMPAAIRTGTDALVGKRALVLERVDADGGRVKIGGEEWSARAFMEEQVIEPGTRVEVARIEGATALVYE